IPPSLRRWPPLSPAARKNCATWIIERRGAADQSAIKFRAAVGTIVVIAPEWRIASQIDLANQQALIGATLHQEAAVRRRQATLADIFEAMLASRPVREQDEDTVLIGPRGDEAARHDMIGIGRGADGNDCIDAVQSKLAGNFRKVEIVADHE